MRSKKKLTKIVKELEKINQKSEKKNEIEAVEKDFDDKIEILENKIKQKCKVIEEKNIKIMSLEINLERTENKFTYLEEKMKEFETKFAGNKC